VGEVTEAELRPPDRPLAGQPRHMHSDELRGAKAIRLAANKSATLTWGGPIEALAAGQQDLASSCVLTCLGLTQAWSQSTTVDLTADKRTCSSSKGDTYPTVTPSGQSSTNTRSS